MRLHHTILLPALVLVAGACARVAAGDPVPDRSFFFPTEVSTSADGRFAYVLNTNFDQRFQAGWLAVVDVDAALAGADRDSIIQQVKVPSLTGKLAMSPDGRHGVLTARGGRPLTLFDFDTARGFASCGSGSDEGLLTEEQFTDCDRAHLVPLTSELVAPNADEKLDPVVFADPYAAVLFNRQSDCGAAEACVAGVCRPACGSDGDCPGNEPVCGGAGVCACVADSTCGGVGSCTELDASAGGRCARAACRPCAEDVGADLYLALTYLSMPRLSLLRLDTSDPAAPSLAAGLAVDLPAETGDAHLQPTTGGTYLVATSKHGNRLNVVNSTVTSFDLGRLFADGDNFDASGVRYRRIAPIEREVGGLELISLAFSSDGRRAYVSNTSRSQASSASTLPDAVVSLDVARHTFVELQADGSRCQDDRHAASILGATPIAGRPQGLRTVDRSNGELVVVALLDQDELQILEPRGDSLQLVRRLALTGQGPYALTPVERDGRELVLVSTFFDHGLSVVDVTSGDPDSWGVVAHIRSPDLAPSKERLR